VGRAVEPSTVAESLPCTGDMMKIGAKTLIGKEDIHWYDGISSSFTRKTTSGGKINLHSYGDIVDVAQAYGDGSPSSAALSNALSAIGNKRSPIFLSEGIWTIDTNLTFTNIPLILGIPGKTILQPSSNVTGTFCTITTSNNTDSGYPYPCKVYGLTLKGNSTTAVGMLIGGTGVSAQIYADEIEIYGFSATNAVGLKIADVVMFNGNRINCAKDNYIGCLVDASDTALPTMVSFRDSNFRESNNIGFNIVDGYQVKFDNCVFESNDAEGLKADTGASENILFLTLNGCWFENNYNGHVSQTSNYSLVADGASGASTCSVQLRDTYFNGSAATEKSISFISVTDFVLDNVRCSNVTDTMSFASSIGKIINHPHNAITLPTVGIVSGTSRVRVEDNNTFGGFVDKDATPDVSLAVNFVTLNSGATTITNLDNGYDGQHIRVFIGDGFTTIDFTGTALKGNAGVDWSPSPGDWMDCVFYGATWICAVHDCNA
jgi:hypothetical protein